MATKKIITSTYNQTIFDLALQEYGSVEGVISIIQENNLESVNEDINSGDEFVIIASAVINKDVVAFYVRNKIKPATADNESGVADGGSFSSGFSTGFSILII